MSLPLTPEERDLMLEMISQRAGFQNGDGAPGQVGVVQLGKLVEYRTKDNDLIRAELTLFRIKKAEALNKAKADLSSKLVELDKQLASLAL